MNHQRQVIAPYPSGWRTRCTCGWATQGASRAEVVDRFLEHCEAQHLDIDQEVE